MKRNIRILIIIALCVIGLFAFISWMRGEWTAYINNPMRVEGRDTAVFWNQTEGGYGFEILHLVTGFDFCAYDSPLKGTIPYKEINNVHYYANTKDYIFIITTDHLNYTINKNTGDISLSSFSETDLSKEEKICFENLLAEKDFRIMKTY